MGRQTGRWRRHITTHTPSQSSHFATCIVCTYYCTSNQLGRIVTRGRLCTYMLHIRDIDSKKKPPVEMLDNLSLFRFTNGMRNERMSIHIARILLVYHVPTGTTKSINLTS